LRYLRPTALLAAIALAACTGQVTGGPDGGPGGGDGGLSACPSEPVGGALAFDGEDDHVTMGVAPGLGLATFTVEAWVRRDGPGVKAGTGVGGLSLVPIAGKGRGENDQGNLNCNYAFGFAGDVLGADFEDDATGANHPVLGKTAVPMGEWHHVAATYDGTTWRLYLDGVLDGERESGATPRADSIQHFGIGALFNSSGTPAGRLHGALDEVRVWDHARSGEEIASWMYTPLRAAPGLVSRWSLDPGEAEEGVEDSTGAHPGTLAGATSVAGAPIGSGLPPALDVVGPVDGVQLSGEEAELAVELTDPDGGDPITTVFHVREVSEADDFTIVVLPDTQYYTVADRNLAQFFYDQTVWVRENRDAYNIVAVIHNGDLVNNGDRYQNQWTVADRAMSTLETPEDGLADGVPYGIAVGNHDLTEFGVAGTAVSFNEYFGSSRFSGRAYYGGHYGKNNNNSWFTFSAGGLDFVVVNLEYDTTQDPAVLAWARSIFEMHPRAFGILNSHYLIGKTGNFGAQGKAIYEALRDVQNLQIMTCGHVGAEAARTDVFEGHPIHTMLADYQFEDDGGGGKLRIWEFSPVRDEVTVRTYSPSRDQWYTGEASEFTLPVDLSGAGGPFVELAAVDDARAGRTSATMTGLTPGKTYEWYATASDCAHTARTPVQRFTVAADGEASERRTGATRRESVAERAARIRHAPLRPAGTSVPLED